MWLIHTTTFERHEFVGRSIPHYAILSHTWGAEEVEFQDLGPAVESKETIGWSKIESCCKQAVSDGLQWIWVDTCCIDKRSSAELTEAINSMFSWYRRAQRCYIYLEDVPGGSTTDIIKQSRWFTRGWTLQELLAPRHVAFFDQSWTYIGCKTSSSWKTVQSPNEADQRFLNLISRITNIPESVLQRDTKLSDVSVARRMSWASHRQTTREEDLAYCLMGLFEVNLPIIYGEGLCKAFRRLQLEIMGQTTDQSIFAWDYSVLASDPLAILASSPAAFKHSSKVSVWGIRDQKPSGAFEMTNSGLQANFVLSDPKSPTPLALLECGLLHADRRHRLAIPLELYQKRQGNNLALYRRRTDLPPSSLKLFTWDSEGLKLTSLDFDAGSRDIIIMELRHYSHWKALVTNTGFN